MQITGYRSQRRFEAELQFRSDKNSFENASFNLPFLLCVRGDCLRADDDHAFRGSTVSWYETSRTFPFLFHGSENDRARVNSVHYTASAHRAQFELLFSGFLLTRARSSACDRPMSRNAG